MAEFYEPRCTTHGPMQWHGDVLAGDQRGGFVCGGFDGEGCTAGPMSSDAVVRVGQGETRWPGVEVRVTPIGQIELSPPGKGFDSSQASG